MTRGLSRLAAVFLAFALTELLLLSVLVPIDVAVHNWMQAHRTCALDRLAFVLRDTPITILILLGTGILVWLCVSRRWAEAWMTISTVVLGEVLCDLLKDTLARARPSALPPAFDGNSFPSSHVVAALLLAGIVGAILARSRPAKWLTLSVGSVLVVCPLLIAWQRVYTGQHWFSDVLGSTLLAGAWLCRALSHPAPFRVSWRSALGWGCLLCYTQLASLFPHLRVRLPQLALPSAMSLYDEPVLDLPFGEAIPPTRLRGAWGNHSREPVGPITWANGEEVGVAVELPHRQAYTLRLAVRPIVPSAGFSCFPLEVSVNHHPVSHLLLSRGWREYRVPISATAVRPGENLISFRVGAEFPLKGADQPTVAFRYLRIFSAP
ncbi:MAG: phosphatase PAP2 family protein [Candidatus Binatia bacterium]|nr:phosphatase PAP2 family protein [Candidatus Binatia bacterium]